MAKSRTDFRSRHHFRREISENFFCIRKKTPQSNRITITKEERVKAATEMIRLFDKIIANTKIMMEKKVRKVRDIPARSNRSFC